MKMQPETESQSSSSLSITVRRFISFWTIPVKNWKLLLACALVRVSCVCSLKKIQWTRSGQVPLQEGFLILYLSYRYLTTSEEECSDQLPSSYLRLHLFASL